MPAYRFSWDLFDERSIAAFAADLGLNGPPADALAYLASHVPRPSDDFVQRTKRSIATVWLPQHGRVGAAIVRELFDAEIGPMGRMPDDAAGCARYVERCRNSSGLRGRLLDRLLSFGDRDRRDDYEPDDDFVPRFGTVIPSRQPLDDRRPYPHQRSAWAAMDEHLAAAQQTGIFKGVVVMPTGAGKTRTAVHWLLRNWIDARKGHVLWVAHRDELLRQAARSFYELAGLAASRDRLRIRVVSGAHCHFHQIDPADDVVVCSVHSLARAATASAVLTHPNLFVVVDEAHHAPARSYRDAITLLEQTSSHNLLGLTATPTRTAEDERPELARLFGSRVIYQVSPGALIAQELMARPIPITVSTGVEGERGMSLDDFAHLRDFHDLSPDMRARLGRDVARNAVVVRHYVDHAAKYGKTLVFAPDVEGAAHLTDAFRARLPSGVHVEYLASYRPDGSAVSRREVLDRFRNPTSGLDVLVNVDMLTEGVDLPITRTVFLARPTSSEILLRQMMGRALRGPAAGGHREAFIVSFDDHWQTFRDVLSPIALIADLSVGQEPMAAAQEAAPEQVAVDTTVASPLPPLSWDRILALGRAIRADLPDPDADVFEAVPHGLYKLEYVVDGEDVQHFVHVYEHQRSCWEALFAHLSVPSDATRASTSPEAILDEFFGDCDDPVPSTLDVATLLERRALGDPLPAYIPIQGRQACDPHELARRARDSDLRASEVEKLLTERYSPLARVIYPTPLDFRRAYDDAARALTFPEAGGPPRGVVMFEPPPGNPLRPGPHHDLNRLMTEMLAEGSRLLGKPLAYQGRLMWTRRLIKGWFGVAHSVGARAGQIRINRLLDSPDFSSATLRFVLWHEFLHHHLQQGHTPDFRRLERMWPGYDACDREMDSLHERFGVQYW